MRTWLKFESNSGRRKEGLGCMANESAGSGRVVAGSVLERDAGALLSNRFRHDKIHCRLRGDQLRRLIGTLEERNSSAAELEWAAVSERFAEDPERARMELSEGFELRVTIQGEGGEELFGKVAEVFDAPGFPELLKSVYIRSDTALSVPHNYVPRNGFELLLDFTRPSVFSLGASPSSRTPNGSHFTVWGLDPSWVSGVYHEVVTSLERHSSVKWLHREAVFDILLWFVGFPSSLLLCREVSQGVESLQAPFLEAAAYVYLFLLGLVVFRLAFQYARWVYPVVECDGGGSRVGAHRFAMFSLSLAVAGSAIYAAISALFS